MKLAVGLLTSRILNEGLFFSKIAFSNFSLCSCSFFFFFSSSVSSTTASTTASATAAFAVGVDALTAGFFFPTFTFLTAGEVFFALGFFAGGGGAASAFFAGGGGGGVASTVLALGTVLFLFVGSAFVGRISASSSSSSSVGASSSSSPSVGL